MQNIVIYFAIILNLCVSYVLSKNASDSCPQKRICVERENCDSGGRATSISNGSPQTLKGGCNDNPGHVCCSVVRHLD